MPAARRRSGSELRAGLLDVEDAAPQPEPVPSPTSGTLDEFTWRVMDELGAIEVAELADVSDEELRTMGLNLVQLKRLRRQIPVASGAE